MAGVDTSIHHCTTGRAADYAAAHSTPSQSHISSNQFQYLTLYGGWFCPFVQRVWLVLHEKKIPHQYIEINPYKKEKHFLNLNPRGLVPTLAISDTNPDILRENDSTNVVNSTTTHKPKPQEKEKVLYESSVVADYLDQAYPSTHPLYPSDAYARARAKLWIDHIASRIVPAFYRFLQHTPDKDYTLASARDEFVKHLRTFSAELRDLGEGPFFSGPEIGMVDIMLIPWACRIFLLDHYKGGSGIPRPGEGGEDEEVWARWRKWFDAVEGRESVKDTLSESERYIEVYRRYAEDTTGSQAGQATRQGRNLP